MSTHIIHRVAGDLSPFVFFELVGTDIAGWTIKLRGSYRETFQPISIDHTVDDAANGQGHFEWGATDLIKGVADWEIHFIQDMTPAPFTVPAENTLILKVRGVGEPGPGVLSGGGEQITIDQDGRVLKIFGGGGSGSAGILPPLAGIAGSVLVEDPIGTLVFRRLLDGDIDPAFVISSFSGPGPLEVGATVVAPAFTAAYNRAPTTVLLDDDEASPQKDVTSTPAAFSSDGTFQKTANNDAVRFTLTADEGGPTDQATHDIAWQPRVYWGVDVDGLSTEADIEGLANSALDNNRNRTFSVTAGAGQHIYFAIPAAYGTPVFTVGGFEGGFELEAAAVSVTNSEGVTQDYDLWKSTNPNLGATTVVVT